VAIERVAYELCEDQSASNVLYFETRFSPHLLTNTVSPHALLTGTNREEQGEAQLDAAAVVEAVLRGLRRGEEKFGVKANGILCCIQGHGEWNDELLELGGSIRRNFEISILNNPHFQPFASRTKASWASTWPAVRTEPQSTTSRVSFAHSKAPSSTVSTAQHTPGRVLALPRW